MIIFDIDNFKSINDEYGHKTGDKILSKLANIVKNSIRKCDILFRVGGEEVAILCPETDIHAAYNVAEKIRKLVETTDFDKVGNITISLGVAEFKENISKEQLYKNADAAMYLAKNTGKNKTETFRENIITASRFFKKFC